MTIVICDSLLFLSFLCVLLHGLLMYRTVQFAHMHGKTKTATQGASGIAHLLIAFTLLGILII